MNAKIERIGIVFESVITQQSVAEPPDASLRTPANAPHFSRHKLEFLHYFAFN